MEITAEVVPATHKINLADYKFCTCMYFLTGRGNDVNVLRYVGLRSMKLGESKLRVHTQ